jgi:hypothetical protein
MAERIAGRVDLTAVQGLGDGGLEAEVAEGKSEQRPP